jgi:hypothetical protein
MLKQTIKRRKQPSVSIFMNILQDNVPSLKRIASIGARLAIAGMLLLPVHGVAQNIIMQDGGSTAIINPGTGTGLLGMNSWSVDTLPQNQLNQQWFWYSVNGSTAQSIDALGAAGVPQLAYGNDGINGVYLVYQDSQLQVGIEYTLGGNGLGSGSADIQEYIKLKNVGSTTNSISFFQYSDFNLLGGLNDSVSISGTPYVPGNPVSGYFGAIQETGTGGSGLAEVIDAPNAHYAEANTVGGVTSTLYKLNNTANLTLSGNMTAAGDVTWALQWTATLKPGETLDITKDKGLSLQIVPEPGTAALAGLGLCVAGWMLRRRHA